MDIGSYLLGKKAGGGSTPTGTIEITQNGITNVSSYASADVNVQPNLETKSITITENTTTTLTPTSGKDGMSSVEITTNVSGGGGHDWSAIGYSGEPSDIGTAYDYAVQVKNNWDTTATSYYEKFENDKNLVYMPLVEINSSATSMGSMFFGCTYLQTIPQLNTSNITSMSNMFVGCESLQTIPQLNTSSVKDMGSMFSSCIHLQTIPQLDTSQVKYMNQTFNECKKLQTIPQLDMSSCIKFNNLSFASCSSLENLGGFKDLGEAYLTTASANYYDYVLNIRYSPKLTHDSLMNVINNLYDIATKGCNTQKLQIDTTNLAKLTANEIAIATNKGWTVS